MGFSIWESQWLLSDLMDYVYLVADVFYEALLAFTAITSYLYSLKKIERDDFVRLLNVPLGILGVMALVLIGEFVTEYYGAAKYEKEAIKLRIAGPYCCVFWMQLSAMLLLVPFIFTAVRKQVLWVIWITIAAFILSKTDVIAFVYESVIRANELG